MQVLTKLGPKLKQNLLSERIATWLVAGTP